MMRQPKPEISEHQIEVAGRLVVGLARKARVSVRRGIGNPLPCKQGVTGKRHYNRPTRP